MRTCACVVLYNPDMKVYSNILSYNGYVEKIFVMDNSINRNDVIDKICLIENVQYIRMNGNEGIAKALKIALENAKKESYDWCLTLDQDSKIQENVWNNINDWLEKYNQYGIISLNYDEDFKIIKNEIIDVKTWITSGNFININQYRRIDGFNEKLFIDYVDFDICHQFFKKDIKVGVIPHIKIEHQIGNPITKKIFGKRFNCMNHSPIRYYYRYRNSKYLYKKDRKFYFKIYYHEMVIDFLKMFLFEKNKKEKIKMIKKGLKDARKSKLGKYEVIHGK